MKYTKIPSTTFQNIQLNAGILVENFDPSTQEFSGILGATSGGVNFNAAPTYEDYGADIDNCPTNTMELKKLTEWVVTMGGTFVTVTAETAKLLVGAADIDADNSGHIIPRNDVLTTDFKTIWFVGDYSDVNDDSASASAGFVAIKLLNGLSTGGFQLQSNNKAKGTFAFTFTGHYSMNAQDVVPFEIYVCGSEDEPSPYVVIDRHALTVAVNEEVQLTVNKYPTNATVTWTSDDTDKVTVTSGGKVKGVASGSAIITASITDSGVTYNDTCTVIVEA